MAYYLALAAGAIGYYLGRAMELGGHLSLRPFEFKPGGSVVLAVVTAIIVYVGYLLTYSEKKDNNLDDNSFPFHPFQCQNCGFFITQRPGALCPSCELPLESEGASQF